jgi:hypothetical protein
LALIGKVANDLSRPGLDRNFFAPHG